MSSIILNTFKEKLKKDILNEFENHTEINYIQLNINNYIKHINFESEYNEYEKQRVYYNRNIYEYKKDTCCARLWNNHYGGRCSRKIKNTSDKIYFKNKLCGVHIKIYEKYGKLMFGLYNEPKPERNLVTLKSLNWK